MVVLTMHSEGEEQSRPRSCSACNVQETARDLQQHNNCQPKGWAQPIKSNIRLQVEDSEELPTQASAGAHKHCWTSCCHCPLAGKCSTRLLGAASLSQTLNSGLLFLLAKWCSLQTFLKPWLDLSIAIVSVDPFNKTIPYINTYGCVYFSSILNLPIGNITFICVSMWNWQGSCPFGSPAGMFCRITAYREGRDPENSCWPQGKSEALKPFRQLIHLNCFLETSQLPQMILSVLRKFY